MSEYGHSAMCDCAVCDDIAFRKSMRRTVAPSECDINPKVVSFSLREAETTNSRHVINNKYVAECNEGVKGCIICHGMPPSMAEHEEAAGMGLDEVLMRRYIQPQILPHATILQLEVDLLRGSIGKLREALEKIVEMRPAVCRDCADDFTEVRNIARKALEI